MCKLSICKEHEFVSMNGHPTTCEDEWGESLSENDLNRAIEKKQTQSTTIHLSSYITKLSTSIGERARNNVHMR
jgi:hypothetical protein